MKSFSVETWLGEHVKSKKLHPDARFACDYINAVVLTSGVAVVQSVATGAHFVVFGGDGNFYARPNVPAAIPAASVTDGTGSQFKPEIWYLTGITGVGLIGDVPSGQNRVVTLAYYSL